MSMRGSVLLWLLLSTGCRAAPLPPSVDAGGSPPVQGAASVDSAEPPQVYGFVDLDLGAADSVDDLGIDLQAAHLDGLTRTTFYAAWRDLEPSDGRYQLEDVAAILGRATAAGLKLTLEIEITNTDCVEWGMTDDECIVPLFPADQPFSRAGQAFDDPNVRRRLAGLVTAIANRFDPAQLTHVFVGNEVDRYMRVVQHDTAKDLAPGFVRTLSHVRAAIAGLPRRPRFGTVSEFQPWSEYLELPTLACPAVDVLALTMYPTEEDAEGDDPAPAKIRRWMATARATFTGCGLAVTEVGASALPPFGSPEEQDAIAAAIVRFLRANPKAFEFTTWFSMFDNADLAGTVFEGTGLQTRDRVKRPAYTTWLSASKG
jgi:hypothetical protein